MATVTASLSLIQEANVIKTYGNWVITISASSSTIAARGGTSTITVSARRTLTYTSGAVGNETGTPTLSFAGTNGYAGFTFANGVVTAENRETTVGAIRSCVVRAKIGADKKDITINQSENAIINTTNSIQLVADTGTSIETVVPASGGAINVSAVGTTTYTYSSDSTSSEQFTPTLSLSGDSTSGFALTGTVITVSDRQNIEGNIRTTTLTGTGNGSTGTLMLYQAANVKTLASIDVTAPAWTGTAAGETVPLIVMASYTYSSGGTSTADVSATATFETGSVGFSVSNDDNTVTSNSRGTTEGAAREGWIKATYTE